MNFLPRFVVVFLLLVNIGFYLWYSNTDDNHVTGTVVSEDVMKPGVVRIRLLNEHDEMVTAPDETIASEESMNKPDPDTLEADELEIDQSAIENKPPVDDFKVATVKLKDSQTKKTASKDLPVPPVVKEKPASKDKEAPVVSDNVPETVIDDENEKADEENPVVTNTEVTCFTLGPFDKLMEAKSVKNTLTDKHIKVRARSSEISVNNGHWVYLPPYPSWTAAKKVVEKLKADGIKDYFIVSGKETNNAISLGVFSIRESAVKRQARLKALGYNAVLTERIRQENRYWLDVVTTDAQAVQAIMASHDRVPVNSKPCQ